MHIILKNLSNQYYKCQRAQNTLLITMYDLVKQKMLQKLELKNIKEENGHNLINFKIINLEYER